MERKCSKCGRPKPSTAMNWRKITSQNDFLFPYSTSDGFQRSHYSESDPYWVLCPSCYEDIFANLQCFKDITSTETKPVNISFTESNCDYDDNSVHITFDGKEVKYINDSSDYSKKPWWLKEKFPSNYYIS